MDPVCVYRNIEQTYLRNYIADQFCYLIRRATDPEYYKREWRKDLTPD